MLLICEGIFFVLGIFIMVTGKFRISRNRIATGTHARVAGLFLFLPGPIALLMGLIIGATESPTQFRQQIVSLTAIEFVLVLGGLILALGIVYTATNDLPATTPVQFVPDILTVAEAAQYLRVSEADVRQMIAEGRLKAVAIGDDYRISKEALNLVFRT